MLENPLKQNLKNPWNYLWTSFKILWNLLKLNWNINSTLPQLLVWNIMKDFVLAELKNCIFVKTPTLNSTLPQCWVGFCLVWHDYHFTPPANNGGSLDPSCLKIFELTELFFSQILIDQKKFTNIFLTKFLFIEFFFHQNFFLTAPVLPKIFFDFNFFDQNFRSPKFFERTFFLHKIFFLQNIFLGLNFSWL